MVGNGLPLLRALDISYVGSNIGKTGVQAVCNGCTRLVDFKAAGCKHITRKFLKKLCKTLPFVKLHPRIVALIPRPGAHEAILEAERMRRDDAAAVVLQKLARGLKLGVACGFLGVMLESAGWYLKCKHLCVDTF